MPYLDSILYRPEDRISKLKPCPFCGKDPITILDNETETKFGVKCFHCGGMIYPEKDTVDEAIEAWNRRTGKSLDWISVKDGLPHAEYGESDNVLTTCQHRDGEYGYRWIKVLYYNGGVWCKPTGETYTEQVVAWMPIPEPYQSE